MIKTPFPPRGIPTFPDPESRPRNSLKSPHNSREWLPGRRRVAVVRLRRRPGYGSRPELFWPWPAKGAASAPLKPPQASASRHGVWLNQPPPLLERVRAGDSTTGGRADTDKRSGPACPRWVGGMLAPLTEPDNRVITDLLLPLLASSTRPAVARALTQRRDFDTGVLRDHSRCGAPLGRTDRLSL